MGRVIKTPERMIEYLVKHIKALESINATYRCGGRPMSIALNDACDTFGWKSTLEKYQARKVGGK